MKILDNVREIPQDWFYELEEKDEPKISTLELIDYDFYDFKEALKYQNKHGGRLFYDRENKRYYLLDEKGC